MDVLSVQAIQDAGLADWSKLASALHARFLVGSFADGVAFAQAVGEVADGHDPDVRVTSSFVDLKLLTPGSVYRQKDGTEFTWSSVTQLDLDLAREISALAAERGLKADLDGLCVVELGLDTADAAEIGPFWSALLTGDPANYDHPEVVDPTGRTPAIWFQKTTPHETPRQRFHFDIWLPVAQAPARIEAALAAGGTLVSDEDPSFTVIADAQGNRACVCTIKGR
ncbi:VOC family protein [Kribbella yunnanensis]|uniref:VOC family protein n=1 Tax=Kribbella yunnanensis TaxID=190194 RepID=A0ABN2GMS2_9ACTN